MAPIPINPQEQWLCILPMSPFSLLCLSADGRLMLFSLIFDVKSFLSQVESAQECCPPMTGTTSGTQNATFSYNQPPTQTHTPQRSLTHITSFPRPAILVLGLTVRLFRQSSTFQFEICITILFFLFPFVFMALEQNVANNLYCQGGHGKHFISK